jgi:Holliday junction resolvase YEN1
LSGNKNNPALNQDEKTDKLHTMLYYVTDLKNHPEIGLTRGGMILFALLAGGDYHPVCRLSCFCNLSAKSPLKGVPNFGKVIAHAVARCDFGDELLEACQNLQGQDLAEFLMHWRMRINQELRTNSRGFLKHRTSLSVPDDFPDREVLRTYANPICSNANSSVALRDREQLDLARVGQLCEEYFEWGYESRIVERFRTLMWPCAVMHVLRRAALEIDRKKAVSGSVVVAKNIGTSAGFVQKFLSKKKEDRTERYADAFLRRESVVETSETARAIPDPDPLIIGIPEQDRRHPSTDGVLEYRVKVSPVQFVDLVTKSLKGKRSAPDNVAKKPDDPNKALKMWLPATMLDHLYPDLVEQYLAKEQEKKKKGKGKTKKGKEKAVDSSDSDCELSVPRPPSSLMSRTDSDTNFDHTSSRAIPDPWFYSDSTTPSPSKESAKRGFLFTFRDPSFDEFPEDEAGGMPEGPSSSSARFDLEDEISNDPLMKCKRKKREREDVINPKTVTGKGRPRKKRRKIDGSASLLEVLDSLDF